MIKSSEIQPFFSKLKNLVSILIAMVVFIGMLINSITYISHSALSDDSIVNLELSYNLAKNGVIANYDLGQSKDLIYSNIREPFPVLLSALWIKLIPSLAKANSLESLQIGSKLIYLKLQNIIYLGVLLIGVLCLTYEIYLHHLPFYLSLLASTITLIAVFNTMHLFYLDTLVTELQAALILVWLTWCWVKAWETQKVVYYVFTGALFGVLILTKAAFIYIGVVLLLFLIMYMIVFKFKKVQILHQLLIVIVASIIVTPWFIRNHTHIGVWELTQRGPIVLLTRAYKNSLTADEFKGAFYAYAPLSLKKIMYQVTGFNGNDRLKDGRLQRLTRFPSGDLELRAQGNEAEAISYYIKASIHANNIRKKYDQQFNSPLKARVASDQEVKRQAISIIMADLSAHLKSTLVFAWRGSWPCNTVDGRWRNGHKEPVIWQELLPFFGLIAMFLLAVMSVIKRDVKMYAMTAFGVSAFCFYALATHFIPRYSEMFIPLWVICFCYLLFAIISFVATTIKRHSFGLSLKI